MSANQKSYELPYHIQIRAWNTLDPDDDNSVYGVIDSSQLVEEIDAQSACAIESFLLAMACNRINIGSPKMVEALETVVEAISNSQY